MNDDDFGVLCNKVFIVAAEEFGVPLSDITAGSERQGRASVAKHWASYLIRELTSASLEDIGRHSYSTYHTTIRYGINKISNKVDTDGFEYARKQRLLAKLINEKGCRYETRPRHRQHVGRHQFKESVNFAGQASCS